MVVSKYSFFAILMVYDLVGVLEVLSLASVFTAYLLIFSLCTNWTVYSLVGNPIGSSVLSVYVLVGGLVIYIWLLALLCTVRLATSLSSWAYVLSVYVLVGNPRMRWCPLSVQFGCFILLTYVSETMKYVG